MILGVNVIRMGALTIVAPSMIVPFAGLPLFGYWVVTTGVALVPPNDIGWVALIPHSVTLIIELQAYLVLLLGAYLLGRYWIRPDLAASTPAGPPTVEGSRTSGRWHCWPPCCSSSARSTRPSRCATPCIHWPNCCWRARAEPHVLRRFTADV